MGGRPPRAKHGEANWESPLGEFVVPTWANEAVGEYTPSGHLVNVWCEDDERLLVCSRERMIGKHISQVLDGSVSRMLQDVFLRVAMSGHYENVKYELEANGRFWQVRGRVVPVVGPRGEVERVRLVARDVSDETSASKRLREKERIIEQVLTVSRLMNAPLELGELFDVLVKECMKATDADAGGMTLRRGNCFISEGFFAEGKHWESRRIWRPEDTLTQWFLVHRVPCVSHRIEVDPRLRVYRARVRLNNAVLVPIFDRSGEVLGFVGVANKKGRGYFEKEDVARMTALAQVASGPIQNAISLRKVEDAKQRVQQVSGALLKAQDDERRRIARILHETTSQDLLAVKMNLGAVLRQRTQELEGEVAALLKETVELTKGTMQGIRTLSYVLHPPLMDESGLACALPWFVNGFAKRSEIDVDMKLDAKVRRLAAETESTLFRVVQEGLANVHRHAESGRASVRLWREGPQVILEVQDYGKGMRTEAGERQGKLDWSGGVCGARNGGALPGVGIAGMRERVEQLGGKFEVVSTVGRGTKIRVVMEDAGRVGVEEVAEAPAPAGLNGGDFVAGAAREHAMAMAAGAGESSSEQVLQEKSVEEVRSGEKERHEKHRGVMRKFAAAGGGSRN